MRLWSLAFFSGILLIQQLVRLPSLYFVLLGLLGFLACPSVRRYFMHQWWCWLVSGLALGFVWGLGHAHLMMSQRLMPQYEGVDLVLEGQIASLPITSALSALKSAKLASSKRLSQQRVSFDFKPLSIISPQSIDLANFPQKIRLSWYRPTSQIEAGQIWRFKVRLKRPYALLNPGGFDYEKYLFQKRVQARGYIRKDIINQEVTGKTSSRFLSSMILELRQSILHKLSPNISQSIPQNPHHKRLVKNKAAEDSGEFIRYLTQALVLGYRGGLEASHWQVFQRTGTIHLMAISGLHIGLVAGLVYALFSLLWRWFGVARWQIPAPQVAAVAALLAAAAYAMLAGFTIPTQRALIMLLVAMLHIVFKRSPMPASKTIALALVLVLLLDPLAVLAQGFWLSFLAVSVIIFLMQQPNPKPLLANTAVVGFVNRIQSLFRAVKQFAQIQWALTIVMFPLVLYFYQASSIVSPLANFIAIPVMSLAVVPLMFIATGLLYVNAVLAEFVFGLIEFVFSGLWQFLEALSAWQYATLGGSIVSPWFLVSSYLAILLWLSIKGTPMRWLAVVLVLPIVFSSNKGVVQGEALVTVLDVGQGLAVVVQTQKHALVFDTGAKYSNNFDMGRAVIAPFLRYSRISSIDSLLISHGDNDHIGGFDSLRAMFEIKRVLTSIPDNIKPATLNISGCKAGQRWQYDGVEFSILSPLSLTKSENGHDENNQSCVLKITTQYGRVLITGDIERETESYLYHSVAKELAAEVLLVPHHGSNTSSLEGFIKAVNPNYAVFSVGYKNRYKLPNKQVLKRYQEFSSATLLNSYETGALAFRLQADTTLSPTRFRRIARRYWHTQAVE